MKKTFLLAIFIFFLFGAGEAKASEYFFMRYPPAVYAGDEVKAILFVNTGNEYINTLSGKINYDADFLEAKTLETGNSVVNLWVEAPQIDYKNPGLINFSGITPGGFQTEAGQVFSVIFQAKKSGQTDITIDEPQTLLNDGQGTATTATVKILSLTAQPLPPGKQAAPFQVSTDNEPPEPFIPILSSNPNLFDGQKIIYFATADKNSGLDHYEVREQITYRLFGLTLAFGGWQKAASPYLLKDQSLQSDITVKAVDRFGNERIGGIPAAQKMGWYKNFLFWGIIIAMLFLVLFSFKKYYVKKI